MNAIELLTEQHEEVNELFEQIEETTQSDEKLALFQELADNLAAHAAIEEKIFYPEAFNKKTKELLTEAVEEHLGVKRLIRDLLSMTPDDDNFDAKIKVLKEQVQHHVHEEEDELFPKARKELGATKLKELGEKMMQMFEKEMSGQPRDKVPSQTAAAASLK